MREQLPFFSKSLSLSAFFCLLIRSSANCDSINMDCTELHETFFKTRKQFKAHFMIYSLSESSICGLVISKSKDRTIDKSHRLSCSSFRKRKRHTNYTKTVRKLQLSSYKFPTRTENIGMNYSMKHTYEV